MSPIVYVKKVTNFFSPESRFFDFINPPLPKASSPGRPDLRRSLFISGKKEDKKLLRKERGREGWLTLIVKSIRLRNPGDPWCTFCMGPSLMQVEQEASCCGLRGTLKSASSAVTTPLAGPNLLLEIQTVSMLPLCVGLSPSAFCCPHLRLTPQSYVNNYIGPWKAPDLPRRDIIKSPNVESCWATTKHLRDVPWQYRSSMGWPSLCLRAHVLNEQLGSIKALKREV